MPVTITAAHLNAVLDLLGSAWLRAIGTQSGGYGLGTSGGSWGAAGSVTSLKAQLQTMAGSYLEPVSDLSPSVIRVASRLDGRQIAANELQEVYAAVQGHVGRSGLPGVGNLDTFLTYYNAGAGGTWQALQSSLLRELFERWQGTPNGLSRHNMYFEVLQGPAYADALAKAVVTGPGAATVTAGYTIDSGVYAGGFPHLKISGLAGSGTVRVTGTAFDPATKAPVENVMWKAVLAGGEVTAALVPNDATPAPADSLACRVTAISVPAGVTAGTFYVEARRPAGRSVLPL